MALRQRGVSVQGLWFNPNIHPCTEYMQRLDAVRTLQRLWRLDIDYIDDYGLTEFVRQVAHAEDRRCEYCYAVRLDKAAQLAKEGGFDAFTTSLLVSPHQKSDMIKALGKTAQDRYSVEFHEEDFRKGFAEGRRISADLGLYRQKYCGCIYSEMDRYKGTRARIKAEGTA
jgi:hypothetical protein